MKFKKRENETYTGAHIWANVELTIFKRIQAVDIWSIDTWINIGVDFDKWYGISLSIYLLCAPFNGIIKRWFDGPDACHQTDLDYSSPNVGWHPLFRVYNVNGVREYTPRHS